MDRIEIYFELSPADTLNSNSMPKNPFLKSGKVSRIRRVAQEIGLEKHPDRDNCLKMLHNANEKNRVKATRSKTKKAMNKLSATKEEIEEEINLIVPELVEVDEKYIFKKFKVVVYVYGSTSSRLDPPNYYPTIKAFIDGLTDAGFWEDDSHHFMTGLAFEYGGKCSTPKKNGFKIVIISDDEGRGFEQ